MEEKNKRTFSPLPIFAQQILLKPSFFHLILSFYFYHGSKLLLTHFLPFPWPINYNHASWCNKSSIHPLPIWFWLKIVFPFLEIMASHMNTSYRPQAVQMNEKLTPSHLQILHWRRIFMMKISNYKRCALVLKLIPFKLDMIPFLRTFTPWWFCCKLTPLLWNHLWRLLRN
jgi:hypothetical protein